MRVHPEIVEAEEKLAELRTKLETASGEAQGDLQFRVMAQTKHIEELRWAHTPRPLSTVPINEGDYVDVVPGQSAERAY
jgi:hypothetical protein